MLPSENVYDSLNNIFSLKANNNDIFALGGFCPTVAPGGYLSGGGFGSLSRLHGFGVDNVLSLNLVTPSGDFLEVGPNSK